jgi:hypothetical protein
VSVSEIKVFTRQRCTAILDMFYTLTVTAPQNTTSFGSTRILADGRAGSV